MYNPLSDNALQKIFKKSTRNPNLIGTNEGVTIEYKQSFGWASMSDYFKAMASFANRDGGYIIFGVKDKPHELLGLSGTALERFENIDNQEWSTNLREHFSPEIIWEKRNFMFEGKVYGVVYTSPASEKPIICKKDAGELKKAAIYYRYNSQNSEIDYPELHAIIELEKEKVNEKWMKTIKQIGDSGIANMALLDFKNSKLTGPKTTLYMDQSLIDEIEFVQEGSFVETGGNPALKVVGKVQTVIGAQPIFVGQDRNKAINADEIISSFITQENVNNPKEFIKQICYHTTGNLPVYYFLNLENFSNEDALELLESVPVNSSAKEMLKGRIINQETKFVKLPNNNSDVTKRKENYITSFVQETLVVPADAFELKYLLIAVRGMEKAQIRAHKDFLLNIIYDIYKNYFNNRDYSSIRTEFRHALCWVDEALFMKK